MKLLKIASLTLFASSPLLAAEKPPMTVFGSCASSMACFEYVGQPEDAAAKKEWCASNAPWWSWSESCDLTQNPTPCVTDSLDDKSILWVNGNCVSHLKQLSSREEAIAYYQTLQTEADVKLAATIAANTLEKETIPEHLKGYCKATVKADFFIEDDLFTSTAKNIGLKKDSEHLISRVRTAFGKNTVSIILESKDDILQKKDFPVEYFDLSCPFKVLDDSWGSDLDRVVIRPVKVYADSEYTQEICEIVPGKDVGYNGTGSGEKWEITELRGQCEEVTHGFTKETINFDLYPNSLVPNLEN